MSTPTQPQSASDSLAFIKQLRRGVFAAELSETIQETVLKVRETGRPGTIKVAIKITPESEGEMVHITDDITATVPKAKRGTTAFYTMPDGQLTRQDPNQTEFKFKVVSETEKPREVEPAAVKTVGE